MGLLVRIVGVTPRWNWIRTAVRSWIAVEPPRQSSRQTHVLWKFGGTETSTSARLAICLPRYPFRSVTHLITTLAKLLAKSAPFQTTCPSAKHYPPNGRSPATCHSKQQRR